MIICLNLLLGLLLGGFIPPTSCSILRLRLVTSSAKQRRTRPSPDGIPDFSITVRSGLCQHCLPISLLPRYIPWAPLDFARVRSGGIFLGRCSQSSPFLGVGEEDRVAVCNLERCRTAAMIFAAAVNENAALFIRGQVPLALSELPVEAKARHQGFFEQDCCGSLPRAHTRLFPGVSFELEGITLRGDEARIDLLENASQLMLKTKLCQRGAFVLLGGDTDRSRAREGHPRSYLRLELVTLRRKRGLGVG